MREKNSLISQRISFETYKEEKRAFTNKEYQNNSLSLIPDIAHE